jgi:hypothetical protein
VAHAEAGYNTITLYAPEAPAGAWVSVQWQDGLGNWHDVESWQGSLDVLEDTGLRLKQWAVSSENADQGPFRWIIYSEHGGAVWGTSASFDLPGGEGVDLAMTVEPQTVATTADAAAITDTPITTTEASVDATLVTDPTTGAPRVAADSSTWFFECDDCDYGLITVFLPDAPAGSWVGVQWQELNGVWHDVEGWQGTMSVDDNGLQFTQWTVLSENFGQGPFRWVVTEPGGSVWGVSPSFTLPTEGVQYVLFLLRH